MHHVLSGSSTQYYPNGLFKNAIVNSPFNPPLYPYNHSIPSGLYNQLVAEVGCDTATNKLQCLRNKPLIPDLRDANIRIADRGTYGTFTWYPVAGGDFVTSRPSLGLGAGKPHKGQNLIVTHNQREGFLFTRPVSTAAEASAFLAELIPTASSATLAALASLYTPAAGFPDVASQLEGMVADHLFQCVAYQLAETFSTGGQSAYKGQWQIAPAFHFGDIEYYFNANTSSLASYSTFENWTGSFTKFVKTGNPNSGTNPNPATNVPWTKWGDYSESKGWEKLFTTNAATVSETSMSLLDAGTWNRCQ